MEFPHRWYGHGSREVRAATSLVVLQRADDSSVSLGDRLVAGISPRLLALVNALPLRSGMCVLEVGCGPGAMAREIARRIGNGHVLAIDRSAKAIAQARAASRAEIAAGRLRVRQMAIEDFEL